MNASSVHLRDLNNLVSAFSGNSHLGSHYTEDPSHSTRFRAIVDDESSYEEDKSGATTFSSKIYCPTISPLQSQSITDKIQHRTLAKNNLLASEKESNGLLFGEQWNFSGKELSSLDLSSMTETDLSETQNGKNSLHLISELCDRLTASDSAEKGKDNKASQTEMVDTANDVASQRLNVNNQTYFSYITPHSQTNTQVPIRANEISKTFVESPYGSYSCTLTDSDIAMPSHNNDAITCNDGYEDFLNQCDEPCAGAHVNGLLSCGTCCEPAGAVSCLEHMIERITPPHSCATPVDGCYKPGERGIQSSNGLTNSSQGR